MIKKKCLILSVIFIGLIISILYANFYWNNFKNTKHTENLNGFVLDPIEGISFEPGKYLTPSIIGKDTVLYFIIGKQILNSYKENKNFFSAQQEFKVSFLYPNIIAFFSYYFDEEIIKNKEIIIGKKKSLILFQIFLYYFSLLFFSYSLQKYIDNKIMEPTIKLTYLELFICYMNIILLNNNIEIYKKLNNILLIDKCGCISCLFKNLSMIL